MTQLLFTQDPLKKRKKSVNQTLSKMWNSALWKTLSGKWKDESQAGRKYVQNTYLIKDFYLESIKNFLELSKNENKQSSKKKVGGVVNGAKDISLKMIY